MVSELPPGEDVELRIFIDRQVVEVFANNRQAMIAYHRDATGKVAVNGFSVGATTTLKKVETWKLKPTNQGFLEAQKSRIWEPAAN